MFISCLAVVQPAAAAEPGVREIASTPVGEVEVLGENRLRVALPLQAGLRAAIDPGAIDGATERLILTLSDIRIPMRAGLYYEIYLNLPPNASANADSPHYAGNLAFFGRHDHIDAATQSRVGFEQLFDVTEVAKTLKANNAWDPNELRLTFVPQGLVNKRGKSLPIRRGTNALIGKVTLATVPFQGQP